MTLLVVKDASPTALGVIEKEIASWTKKGTPPPLIFSERELNASADRFVGGLYFPDDGAGDARMYVEQLAEKAKAKGARIELGVKATGIRTHAGKVLGVETAHAFEPADRVIVCSGHAAPKLASPLGVRLAIKPAKGYSVTVDARTWNAKPRMAVVDDAMHAAVRVRRPAAGRGQGAPGRDRRVCRCEYGYPSTTSGQSDSAIQTALSPSRRPA